MREHISKNLELYRSWGRVFAISVLLNTVIWLVVGKILTADFFNIRPLDWLRALNKDNSLEYLAVIFAVLIPVYMGYIQQMVTAGYVYRKALPRIFEFKEVLVILIISSLHVLISSREAYLYFPVIIMTLASLYVIFSAFSITFQFELYKNIILDYLKKTARNSAKLMIDGRIKTNKAMEELKKNPYISLFEYHKHPENLKAYPVLSKTDTVITLGREKEINKLLNRDFQDSLDIDKEAQSTSETMHIIHPHFDLKVFPGASLEAEDVIGRLYLPENIDDTEAEPYIKKIQDIYSSSRTLPLKNREIRHLDELFVDLELGFNSAISKKDEKLLQDMLDLYDAITDGMDRYIKSQEVDEYNLDSAKGELRRINNDDLGNRLNTAFDLLFNAAKKIFKAGDEVLAKVLIRYVYGNLINRTRKINISSIARHETLFMHYLGLFTYSNSWNRSLSSEQASILEFLLFRIKEHTRSLVYSYEAVQKNEVSLYKQKEQDSINSWVRMRVNNLRSLALSGIKNDNLTIFETALKTLDDLSDDGRYLSSKLDEELEVYIQCSLLLVYAYASHSNRDSEILNTIKKVVGRWSDRMVTQVVLKCHKEQFADQWRIENYDIPADGAMHSVPDYDLVLKSVWVELMLDRGNFVVNTDHYGNQKLIEETTFFTGGSPTDGDNSLLKRIDEKDAADDLKEDLRQLVVAFIKLRRNWEASTLAAKELDEEKVTKLRDSTIEAYREYSVTNRLIPAKNIKFVKDPTSKKYKRVGINQIFDKEAFIDEWHIGYSNDHYGQQLGENIAQTQDNNVLHEAFKTSIRESNFDQLFEKLQDKGTNWFVFGNNVGSWDIEYQLKDYVKRNKDGEITFKKIKTYAPISFGYIAGLPSGLFFVAKDNTGVLKVKAADPDEMINVDVSAYSHNTRLLNEILSSPPQWLKEKGDKEAQRNYLVKKVRLLIGHVYCYLPSNNSSVFHFPMKDD